MRALLRGVRVIDPAAGVDAPSQDVWIEAGRLRAIDRRIDAGGVPVIDLTPREGAAQCVVCPGFIDLHAHLREPGDDDAETVVSGADAAAAGGFTTVVAMANTRPPIDTQERVRDAVSRNRRAAISVLQAAALSRDLEGLELADIDACLAAGAVAVSDDGRNAAPAAMLEEALRRAARTSHAVLVHPEDEHAIAGLNAGGTSVARCAVRPAETEARAVAIAIDALARAGAARLHLQHVSTAAAVDLLRRARERGLAVTAEVTPHHLSMSSAGGETDPLRKVNPPLRGEADRIALLDAVREGVIDAVATDHAPHRPAEKARDYADAAPGMTGFDTALAACITHGGLGEALATLVARLTVGPHGVLGSAVPVAAPRLRPGEPATLTVFDPDAEWSVSRETLRSRSTNTPLVGERLRGRVLLTVVEGRIAYADPGRAGAAQQVAHA